MTIIARPLSRPDSPPVPRSLRIIVAAAPPPALEFDHALLQHCRCVLNSVVRPDLTVELHLRTATLCPRPQRQTVFRVVDELLCNAVQHGFYCRLQGCILVELTAAGAGGLSVSVSDDGWGFDDQPIIEGNGFRLLRLIGGLTVDRAHDDITTVSVAILRRPRWLA